MSVSSALVLLDSYYRKLRERRETADNISAFTTLSATTVAPENGTTLAIGGPLLDKIETDDEVILGLHGIIFLLALIGNGLVITTLVQHRGMRTITNIFLLNLAISDLLLAIVCMPFTIIPMVLRHFMFGETMCVLIRYLQGVTVSASAFTLVAISLERFYAICKPLKSRKWQNVRHSYKVLGGIWVAAMILNIPMAAFQSIVTDAKSGKKQCTDLWPSDDWKKVYYVFHLLVTDLLVPLTIMSIAYGLMAKTLWNGFKNITVVVQDYVDSISAISSDSSACDEESGGKSASVKAKRQMSLTSDASDTSDESEMPLNGPLTPNSPSCAVCTSPTDNSNKFNYSLYSNSCNAHRQSMLRQETLNSMRSHSSKQAIRSKKRVVKMLFVIVIEFFVCWTPLYLIYLWIVLDNQSARQHIRNPSVTLSTLRLIAYVSSCCNPITYCFMSKKFRMAFKTAFRCRKNLQRQSTYQNTQVSYCDNNSHPHLRSKLSLPALNGHHSKPQLPVLPEASSDNETARKV